MKLNRRNALKAALVIPAAFLITKESIFDNKPRMLRGLRVPGDITLHTGETLMYSEVGGRVIMDGDNISVLYNKVKEGIMIAPEVTGSTIIGCHVYTSDVIVDMLNQST